MPTDNGYAYNHFTRRSLREDMRFHGGPRPGEPFPDFDIATAEGGRLRKEDLRGRPFVVVTSSLTCPMTASANRKLYDLHRQLGKKIDFVTLYVREAHPGDRLWQPSTIDDKRARAKQLQERDKISWTVGVDDLEGTLHRAIDTKANSAYVVSRDGKVAFRALWAADPALTEAIRFVAEGAMPRRRESLRRVGPILAGVGLMNETLRPAGREAERDLRQQVPPMYALSKIAALYRMLPPLARGVAAAATLAAGIGVIVTTIRAIARRRS
jgi:hypothetical protein